MSLKKEMPKFQDDAEYGRWMRAHQDELEDYLAEPTPEDQARVEKMLVSLPPRLESAQRLSEVKERIAAERKPAEARNVAIRMPNTMIEKAKYLAGMKGMPYQTLLKSIIHEGLERLAGE